MTHFSPRAASPSATRRHTSRAISTSTARGRCGPWASVAPTGNSARAPPFASSATSVHGSSSARTLPPLLLELRLEHLAPVALGERIHELDLPRGLVGRQRGA